MAKKGTAELPRMSDAQYKAMRETIRETKMALREIEESVAYDGSMDCLRADVKALLRVVAKFVPVVEMEGEVR